MLHNYAGCVQEAVGQRDDEAQCTHDWKEEYTFYGSSKPLEFNGAEKDGSLAEE